MAVVLNTVDQGLNMQQDEIESILSHLIASRKHPFARIKSLQALCLSITFLLVLVLQLGYLFRRHSLSNTRPSSRAIRTLPQTKQNCCQKFKSNVIVGYVVGSTAFALCWFLINTTHTSMTNTITLGLQYWSYSLSISSIIMCALTLDVSSFVASVMSIIASGCVFPFFIWIVWTDGPFNPLSPRALFGVGAVDFGGGGALHVVAGSFILTASLILPLTTTTTTTSKALSTSTMLLWMGTNGVLLNRVWLVTQPSSRISLSMSCLVNTCLAVAGGGIVGFTVDFLDPCAFDGLHNCIFASLIAISCIGPLAEPYVACLIGITSALLYLVVSRCTTWPLNGRLRGSIILHLVCGSWGVLSGGFAGTTWGHWEVYRQESNCGLAYSCGGLGPTQWAANVVYLCFLLAFSGMVALTTSLFLLRLPTDTQEDPSDRYIPFVDDYGLSPSSDRNPGASTPVSQVRHSTSLQSTGMSMSPGYDDILHYKQNSTSTWV